MAGRNGKTKRVKPWMRFIESKGDKKFMKKALIVGIDNYLKVSDLNGCVNDAHDVANVLLRNADGSLNFDIKIMTSTSENNIVTKYELEEAIKELFSGDDEIALFYFSGHGYTEDNNGYIIPSDIQLPGRNGIKMDDIMQWCNKSKVKNKILIFDCCHAGAVGDDKYFSGNSIIGEGVTILSACTKGQYALEHAHHGVFTQLLVDALNGSGANILGQITPGSVYAHIDQSLGAWSQRPVFKTNVEQFVCLRQTYPSISSSDLRQITNIFKNPSEEFALDPSYEPDCEYAQADHTRIFGILQNMVHVNLVVPVGERHMYYAAMNSKSCKLTTLGAHYWNLVKNNRL